MIKELLEKGLNEREVVSIVMKTYGVDELDAQMIFDIETERGDGDIIIIEGKEHLLQRAKELLDE